MRLMLFCAACLLSALSLAAESKVYLLATLTLGGSNLSSSIFLYDAEITDLQGCRQAVSEGQQHNDWLHYHHILQRDKIKGFTAQASYHCVYSELDIEPWYDKDRYDYAYLIRVDTDANLQVARMDDLSACQARLGQLAQTPPSLNFCAKGSQRIAR